MIKTFSKSVRRNLRLTQNDFAQHVGVSAWTVSRWESGKAAPSAQALQSLASFLSRSNGHAQALPEPVASAFRRLRSRAAEKLFRAIPDRLPRLYGVRSRCGLDDIVPQACLDCGKQAAHYDHRDYFKPLDVVAVCASCNSRRGIAINTFTDHWQDYWVEFDWAAPAKARCGL